MPPITTWVVTSDAPLVGVDGACPPDRLLHGGAHRGVELLEASGEFGRRDPDLVDAYAVEALAEVLQGCQTALPDVVADRAHRLDRRLDVERRPRQDPPQGAGVEPSAAQVKA
jgi:hypothetical protein